MKSTTMISEQDKAYFCRLNRQLVFGELIRYYAQKAKTEGLTQKKIAEKLDMDHGQVCRLLSEPRNLTLDSLSKLLLAMDAQMEVGITSITAAPELEDFMEEFASWSRNQSLGASNIVSFVDKSPKTAKTEEAATNPPSSFVGESDGRYAIG